MKSSFLLSALLSATLLGGEHTIQTEPFETSLSLDATFIPTQVTVLKIEPEQWSKFTVTELVKHGASVKKGDILLSFESEDYDLALAEARETAKSQKLNLAKAERELRDLELTTPRDLEQKRLGFERKKEALDHFTQTGRELEIETAKDRLDGAKRNLSYFEEELKQLLKMYEEDGTTEETEEIILKRQRASVKSAQFALKKAEQSTKWALEKTIPRRAADLQRDFDKTLLSYETAKVNLPRTLQLKRLAVEKAQRNQIKADKKLAELEADKKFFQITAPADGVIYYVEIDEDSWSLGSTSKYLFVDGSVPANKPLMTLVQSGSPLALHGSVGQADRLELPSNASGTATVNGLDDATFPTAITSLDNAPNGGGKYHVAMEVKLPADTPIVGGMKGKAKLVTYRNEAAIIVPKTAITTKDGKSTVEVKMADGKSETREIKTGRRANGNVEIIEGLAVDQVVIVPDSKK